MTKASWTEILRVVRLYRNLGVEEDGVWWFADQAAALVGYHDVEDACLDVAKGYLETLTGFRDAVYLER